MRPSSESRYVAVTVSILVAAAALAFVGGPGSEDSAELGLEDEGCEPPEDHPQARADPDDPPAIFKQTVTLFVTTSGALHPQGTCRAGADKKTSVVDTNCMSWDVENLMCCDASVIPNHISSNPNSMIMAVASRASEYIITQIYGKSLPTTPPQPAFGPPVGPKSIEAPADGGNL